LNKKKALEELILAQLREGESTQTLSRLRKINLSYWAQFSMKNGAPCKKSILNKSCYFKDLEHLLPNTALLRFKLK